MLLTRRSERRFAEPFAFYYPTPSEGKIPMLNAVYEKAGIKTDAYRIRLVTRAESGGLENRSAAGNKAYEDAVNR